MTVSEEKNDVRVPSYAFLPSPPSAHTGTVTLQRPTQAEDDTECSSNGHTHTDDGTPPLNEENDDSGPDLDASMEDMDEEQNSDEVEEGITEEFEEEPSDM